MFDANICLCEMCAFNENYMVERVCTQKRLNKIETGGERKRIDFILIQNPLKMENCEPCNFPRSPALSFSLASHFAWICTA